ncbi:cyanophycinase [Lewinella cohaerens]|uniref:cyanophycinase n=1 Tax=Lewinella cohaerens TaxID=70995 RepID=UPI00036CF098|nr:cyanophycinase [Lewinella cohaerens]
MRSIFSFFVLPLFFILFSCQNYPLLAQPTPLTTGPETGSLVVAGGGRLGDDILLKFIELAGGMHAPLIVIPTAAGNFSYNQDAGVASDFRRLGAQNVQVIHTDDPDIANSATFTQPLENAGGVWFGGGRQWRLVDAYEGTRSEELFRAVLSRGGAIGGSSAGATIQGSYLARGDTKNNQIMMGDHEEGFGFIKNIAIDQHVLARNRQFDLFTILDKRPELLGIGLDEGTAIIVQGNNFEVMGPSYVLIYDKGFWSGEGSSLKQLPSAERSFYFLRKGDQYDMKNRKVLLKD